MKTTKITVVEYARLRNCTVANIQKKLKVLTPDMLPVKSLPGVISFELIDAPVKYYELKVCATPEIAINKLLSV